MTSVLIADDDPQLLRAMRITLRARGYDVVTANDGGEAISAVIDKKPDLMILDLGMPGYDGFEVIRAIRGWSALPILVLSGRTGAADKVKALDCGADDYVTKPFSMEELLARLRVMARRHESTGAERAVVTLGSTHIDMTNHLVERDGTNVRLTATEWQVLELMLNNPGKLITRQMFLKTIWGSEHVNDTGYLRLYISQLRRKLEEAPSEPRYILTEQGMGYRLVLDAAED